MADFSTLKAYIASYVKQNGVGAITGEILQDVLLEMVEAIGDEALNSLASALGDEITNRQNAVAGEAETRGNADTAMQNAINAINTKLSEGYVYAGIATTTTNPSTPTGKVFYFALAAGTYTYFVDSGAASIILTQGISILKYNGTAWSSEQLTAIDDAPTNGSSALVKSGGVFTAIAAVLSKVADGYLYRGMATTSTNPSTPQTKVFYIATDAGTYTNFLDGSSQALVLTRGINIIKFDGTAWSQEQVVGIDGSPTQGSHNMVDSEGIFKFKFNGYYNSSAESPYSDLNDLPLGSITTWGNLTGISNIPPTDSAAGGTVVCACGRNSWPTGAFQLFISPHYDHYNTAHIYFRQWWGGETPQWSQWNRVVNETDIPYMVAAIFNGHDPSGLTDLDNLPIGTVTSFTSFKSQNISNRPPIKDDVNVGGTVICTNARYNNSTCSTQICVTNYKDWNNTPHVYVRYKWGDGSGWSQWIRTANYSEIGMVPIGRAGSTYPNLNNLPLNTIAGYVLFTDIQNAPPVRGSWGGTVITTNCDSQDALKIQICISTKDDYNKTGHIYFRTLWGDGQGWTPWNRVVNYDEIDINYNSLSSFLRIGVVGDSFASGAVFMPGSTVYTEYWSISWVQQLARINGSTGINYSSSGLYCKTWLTDTKGKAKLEADGACDLYYLALGINDSNNTATQPLGSIADIHDGDPSQNADSFYGNYGRIVEIIKAHAPNAKIIFSTMANNSGTKATFNTAIEAIASHYDVPVIKQYEDGFFTSDYYLNHMIEGHPTVQVYGGMAKAIERLTKKCMLNNITYFNDIQPTSVGQP